MRILDTRHQWMWLGSALLLAASAAQAQRTLDGSPRIMQGPMVGAVTKTSIPIWVRVSGPYSCMVEYSETAGFSIPMRTPSQKAGPGNDYTLVLQMEGLKPGTSYYYRVLVEGRASGHLKGYAPFPVRTAPDSGSASGFTAAFGSAARFHWDRLQPIWESIQRQKPDFFMWLGNNAFGDTRHMPILAEEYRRQRDIPSLQALLRSTPQLAVWDDHDYGLSEQDHTSPFRGEALEVFRNYWANPSYGKPDCPGVFFRYRYGGVDFFFLDTRYHRDPNHRTDVPGKTMLGKCQMEWLQSGLKASDAPFKALISASGWSNAAGEGGNTWSAFLHERSQLFDYIMHQKIGGVVLLSGNSMMGEVNCIPWSDQGGYDLYEFSSSPLAHATAEDPTHSNPEIRVRPAYTQGNNFGLLSFDLQSNPPELVYRLLDETGREVYTPVRLKAHELRNGVSTWKVKKNDLAFR